MAGQINEVIGDVARKLERVDERYLAILQELSSLKNDREWIAEERRKVDRRLETGDHTFEAMRAEIREADRIARVAMDIAGKALKSANRAWSTFQPLLSRKPETSVIRKKWREALIEYAIKAGIGIVLIGLYHVLVHGPAIAKAIKAVNGGNE